MDATALQERRTRLAAELQQHSMYDLLGAEAGIRAIVDHFYDLMDSDPAFAPIREMHQPDLTAMRRGLFEFLSGWLGGPPLFVARTGSPCITRAHAPFEIDARARDLWLACIERAMVAADVAERHREALLPALEGIAEMLRNDER